MINQKTAPATISAGRNYLLATHGSCNPNPGTGGWGVVIQLRDGDKILKQRALAGQGEVMISTNQKMDLTAPIRGLERLVEPIPTIVVSGSQNVVLGMNGRLNKWKSAGWRKADSPVANQELWEQLDLLCQRRSVEWVGLRDHVGRDLHKIADQLARNGAAGRYPRGERSAQKQHPEWFFARPDAEPGAGQEQAHQFA